MISNDVTYGDIDPFEKRQLIDHWGVKWQGRHVREVGSLKNRAIYDIYLGSRVLYAKWSEDLEDDIEDYDWVPIDDDYDGDWEIDDDYDVEESNTISDQEWEQRDLADRDYPQEVRGLDKEIKNDPTNPFPYLERAFAYFNLGQYDRSLEDYKQFNSRVPKTSSPSIAEFSLGFAKGLPGGVYESGKGFLFFLVDFVKQPIQTSIQIVDSVTALVQLVRTEKWTTIAESLSPEVHKLVTQWDALSSEERGRLAGYAIGKHGADILAPGAIAKLASKSVKSAKELAAVCKNLRIAEETLVLETAAEVGNTAKVAEAVRNGQTMMALGEDVGLTTSEMAQLKQAGKLEGAINSSLEKLVAQSDSEVLKAAISQDKHVKMVKDYLDKPTKEIQKGINSYEKQMAIHKDKITNPVKYYPNWDKLDPRQREALVSKKWPAEIKGFEEQRNVLQSILNERISHE